MDVTAMIALGKAVAVIFLGLTALTLTKYKYPSHYDVEENAVYNYVVVGAGTAGSIVAYRLSEDPCKKVLLIEAGDDPRWETELAGLFPYLTKSAMDWNYTSENDNYTSQYNRDKYLDLPAGKAVGGSSSMHHIYYVRGEPYDYQLWAAAAGDDSWTWSNLLPYFKKTERLEDPEILNSESSIFHGTDGFVGLTRETRNETRKYLDAFSDVGHTIRNDLCTNESLGFARPLFYISDGIRQSSAECFLAKAKNRPNLHLMKKTTVTKVLFDESLNALGVQCRKEDGTIINVYAEDETILTAGAFNTPKILMLSGIGPRDHLESLDIPVLYDSPVGQNLQDHTATLVFHKLEATNDAVATADPHHFPLATFVGAGALDQNQGYADYVTLNLICRNNPAGLLLLSAIVFGLHDDVCNQLAAIGTGNEILFTVFNVARPVSTGQVLLRSTDPDDAPKIYMGHFSNNTDLLNNAAYIQDFIKVVNSDYFQSVGGETIHLDLPACAGLAKNTTEYWTCYCLQMMYTTFHYSSTCRMGSVLDSKLRVIGVNKLRVGDASAMPNQVTANINTAVMVIAEKLSDMIKEANSYRNNRSNGHFF